VRAPDGAVLDVPREAMAAPLELSIATSSLGALPLPQGAAPIGSMYAMTPHGVSFRQLTRVSLPIDPAKVPAGAVVKIARANPGGQWTLLDTQVEGNVARAFTDKFSYFVPVVVNFVLINPIAPRATVQFSVAGQNPVAARTPVIVYSNGAVDPYRESLQVLTQASAAAPLQVTIRSLIPDGSAYAQDCGTGAVQAVVMAKTARMVPDPERPGQLLVRTA
jgi:hypothetical protein